MIQSLQFTVGFESGVLRRIESMGKKRAMAGCAQILAHCLDRAGTKQSSPCDDLLRVARSGGEVSESMVMEGIASAEESCGRVSDWTRTERPELMEGAPCGPTSGSRGRRSISSPVDGRVHRNPSPQWESEDSGRVSANVLFSGDRLTALPCEASSRHAC